MIEFFNKFKKPCFGPIFSIFSQFWGAKQIFRKIWRCNPKLPMGFQHHAKIQKKLMIQFQGNAQIGGQREGWKEEQTLFYYRTLLTTVRVYLFSIPRHFHQSQTKKKTSAFVSVSVEEKFIFVLSMFIHKVTTRPYSASVVLLDNQIALVN